jgi:hypothetical protein
MSSIDRRLYNIQMSPRYGKLFSSLRSEYLIHWTLRSRCSGSYIVQALTSTPDLDRAVGRAFLCRASPVEFFHAISAFASLPEKLIKEEDTMEGGHAALLQSSLQKACSSQV